MSTVKISELALISQLNANTSNTLFVAVDVPSGVTGKFTGHTLAQGLYSNEVLNVGANPVAYPGVIAQFSGNSTSVTTYLQVNFQNFTANGSTDYVASTSDSTNANSFIDMGISGKDYSDPVYYSAFKPYDGYVYVGGPTTTSYSGNLILGTSSTRANIIFMVGGTMSENVVGYITNNGYNLLSNVSVRGALSTTTGLRFADGSTQNTASNPAVYSQAAYGQANTATTIGQAAYGQANTATTIGQAAFTKANNALANTSGTFAGNLAVTGNVTVTNVTAANSVVIGNVVISNNSIISSATNQDFIIGQPSATANLVINRTLNVSRDIIVTGNVIATSIQSTTGAITTGNLIVVGTTNVTGTSTLNGIVTMNAQVVMTNGTFSNTQSALRISATPTVAIPSNDGYMVHISGKQNVASRIVSDSYGANTYVVYAGRSARGNVTNPTAVQSGDILSRFSGNGYGATGWAQFGSARIDFVASENYTDAARGSQIQFWNVPAGSNTLTKIATFNGTSVEFTGTVNPQKGFIYTPTVYPGAQTAITIDFANNSIVRANSASGCTVSFANYITGKEVVLWLTNTSGSTQTFTHGVTAINSTVGSATYNMPGSSTLMARYFSIDGDLANTFCAITHA